MFCIYCGKGNRGCTTRTRNKTVMNHCFSRVPFFTSQKEKKKKRLSLRQRDRQESSRLKQNRNKKKTAGKNGELFPAKKPRTPISLSPLTLQQSSLSGFLSPMSDLTHFPDPPILLRSSSRPERRRETVGDRHRSRKSSGQQAIHAAAAFGKNKRREEWRAAQREAGRGGRDKGARAACACACFGFAVGDGVGVGAAGGAGGWAGREALGF